MSANLTPTMVRSLRQTYAPGTLPAGSPTLNRTADALVRRGFAVFEERGGFTAYWLTEQGRGWLRDHMPRHPAGEPTS